MSRHRFAALAVAAIVAPLALGALPSGAAPRGPVRIGVPTTVGKSATVTYGGTLPAGRNPGSVCATPASADAQRVRVDVPAGAYQRVEAHLTFRMKTASPAVDGVLSVLGPDGAALDSSDGNGAVEEVTVNNPAAGVYTVLACGFALGAPASYTAAAQVDSVQTAATNAQRYPAAPSQGLSFTAGVAADPQRDQGEPEVMIDNGGNIYTCGPSGFSNIADYMEVSTDGGDQYHLLGAAPRGQISTAEGGGDCGLASAPVKNASGNYNLAYSGLGPLANFTTATSSDTGRSLAGSPVSESPPGVDRQWHVFIDEKTVFLNYNQSAINQTVQKSTDGGLTYGPAVSVANDGNRIGPMRAILPKDASQAATKSIVYFPYTAGSRVKLALSRDSGATWSTCVAVNAEADPNAGFALADHDRAGNVYVVYAEKGGDYDTYLTALPAAGVAGCKDGKQWPGARPKTRVNRARVESTVMPWVTAGGAPGRVAVAFYGTESIGNANNGNFKAAWDVYVSQSLNGMSANPSWAQVKATNHPFHYNSICLGGLGCDLSIPKGDRSLADYFAIDLNPKDGRLSTVFNASNKVPSDEIGHIATPVVVTQNDGPSNLGFKLKKKRNVRRIVSVDPAGDAIAPYSNLTPGVAVQLPSANQAAMDFQKITIDPEIDLAT
ncbi:MAG: hypothetical protein LC640_04265, partial [Frankia sp.]|nr:hypothetical protein [Frankia sp.]